MILRDLVDDRDFRVGIQIGIWNKNMFSKNISGLIKKYVNKRIGYSLKNNIQNVVFYIISVKKKVMLNIILKVLKISRFFYIIMVEIVIVVIKVNLINKKIIVCSLIKIIYIIMIS